MMNNKDSQNDKGSASNAEPEVKVGEFATKKGEIVLREHKYDGIQEYDQKLPNWWLMVLWASIGFFFVYYIIYYTMGLLPTSTESMDQRVEMIEKMRADALERTLSELDDQALVAKWSKDPTVVASGKAIFESNCVACHGANLQGSAIGRSLVDTHWEHGDKPMELFNLILNGTPKDKPGFNNARMPAWPQLGAKSIAEVTAYIISENKAQFEKFEAK